MTFLKKFGSIVAQISKIAIGIVPLIPSGNDKQTKVTDTLIQVAGVILTTEALASTLGTSGSDKLRASAPLVAQIILSSDLMIGKKIDNPVRFQQGCEAIAHGMAELLNSFKADSVETKDLPK